MPAPTGAWHSLASAVSVQVLPAGLVPRLVGAGKPGLLRRPGLSVAPGTPRFGRVSRQAAPSAMQWGSFAARALSTCSGCRIQTFPDEAQVEPASASLPDRAQFDRRNLIFERQSSRDRLRSGAALRFTPRADAAGVGARGCGRSCERRGQPPSALSCGGLTAVVSGHKKCETKEARSD